MITKTFENAYLSLKQFRAELLELWVKSLDDRLIIIKEWMMSVGPRGGKVWTNSKTGKKVYGKKPGGDGKADKDASSKVVSHVLDKMKAGQKLNKGEIASLAKNLKEMDFADVKSLRDQLAPHLSGQSKSDYIDNLTVEARRRTSLLKRDSKNGKATKPDGKGRGRTTQADGADGKRVEAETSRSGVPDVNQDGDSASQPASQRPAKTVPAPIQRVNEKLDRYTQFFRDRGQYEVADWMDRLKGHVNAVGVESALEQLGPDLGKGSGDPVQYEGAWNTERVAGFVRGYLERTGVSVVNTFAWDAKDDIPLFSSSPEGQQGTADRGNKDDFLPKDPKIKDKLEEAKRLPGLEKSEDINVIAGAKVTHLTPDVITKLDARYGEGKWIVKAYGDDAAAGYGIFFHQFAKQKMQDAQVAIWNAGSELAKYGFSIERRANGYPIGIKHTDGRMYNFNSPAYDKVIDGDARKHADIVAAARNSERGAALPKGGKQFMAQPAFEVVGVSDAERAAGKTIASGEGRVHVITRNGQVEIVPNSTWIKGESLPVVFESPDTLAMAQAAKKAIEALPESERQGQIYAPDIVRAVDGFKVVEANPANETGSSGYLGDNPMIIDSYVSHLSGRTPAHVQFIRGLLTRRAGQ